MDKLHELQLIIYSLQFNQNNSFSITMQLHYNCTHAIMLISFIVIHLLKFDTWHDEFFLYNFFSKYWFPSFIMIVNDGPKLWHVTQ
jgi:hypothetical protein